jgi:hypothetical protein
MAISATDRQRVRDLATRVAEIAALPVQQETVTRWQRLNQLQPGRPLVRIFQVPWHEMNVNDELTCVCEDDFARGLESSLRLTLYQWQHLRDDTALDGFCWCPYAITDTGFGISETSEVNNSSGLASRHFHAQIQTLDDIEKIRFPEVTHDPAATAQRAERLDELVGDLMPVRTKGISHLWFAPWDLLITWYGVEQAMLDMVLQPELVNACMERLVDAYLHRLRQWEEQNLLSLPNVSETVGSGGPGLTTELPPPGYDPQRITPRDLWGCATPQIFSEVSPEMHWEFALRHELRWLEKWGLTYYGCCEPLHHKIDLLRRIPNLRKISCSPKADKRVMAENCRGEFAVSLKPNPALLAMSTWDVEVARHELREELTQLEGCVVEIVLKDISTVMHEPRRLWEWATMAREVAAEFGE